MLSFVENKAGHIQKTFTRNDMVPISRPDLHRGKVLKICHSRDLFDLLIFSQIMILMKIVAMMNKMIPYNQVTNHFLGKLR